MRLPLNSIYITNHHGTVGFGYFGKHAGWDLRAAVGTPIYAKERGVVTERYIGSKDIQVLSVKYSDYEHRYLHLSEMHVNVGEVVKEGQLIALSGNSGGVAAHLHEDIRKIGTLWTSSYGSYIDPEVHYAKLLNPQAAASSTGDIEMFKTDQEVVEAYLLLRGVAPTSEEVRAWLNLPKQRFFQVGKAEADAKRAYTIELERQLAEVKQALTNEQLKPPKEVVKVVETIVEKPVEIIKEVQIEAPVNEKEIVTNFFKRIFDSFFKK